MEFVDIAGLRRSVSRIGLGTWSIGGWMWGGTVESTAVRTILKAFEMGINVVDTAPVYGFGVSEEIVGKALAAHGKRDEILVLTKAGLEWDGNGIRRNSSRARLEKEIVDSLKRLGTEYIDLYQIHWPDQGFPLEETAETLERLKQKGLIRAIGVSNFSPAQMDRFRTKALLSSDQPPFNIFERGIEKEVLPYCRTNNIRTVVYGVLCRGLLSGTVTADRSYSGDDLRKIDPKFSGERLPHYIDAVRRIDAHARERHGKDVLTFSVRWALDRPGVDVVLWGARKPEQLSPIPRILGWKTGPEDASRIDRILEESVPDPVGPEFMAPPESVSTTD